MVAVLPPPDGKLWHLTPPVLGEPEDGLDTKSIVHGGMWPSQRKFWELPNFIRGFIGGYGSGKTVQLCKRMISLAVHNAPIPVAIVSPTYAVARQTVVASLRTLLQSLDWWFQYWSEPPGGGTPLLRKRIEWKEKKSAPYEFEIAIHDEGLAKNGKRIRSMKGTILIYSGENPEKLKGPNLAAAGIDEPFIQDFEVFEQMVVRCRHPRARKRELNLTGTPEQLNWGYDLFEGELTTKYPDVGLVQASTLENLALPASYIQTLLSAFDDKVAQAYLHGLFVNLATGLVYYGFDRRENVVDIPAPPGASLFAGMDFNVNPMAATVGWYSGGRNPHVHYFDEIELPNSDTPEMCSKLAALYGRGGAVRPNASLGDSDIEYLHSPLRQIMPDSNAGRATNAPGGKTDYDLIEEAGFEVEKRIGGNPLKRDRFNIANGLLRAKGGKVRLTFSPRCKKLIKYQQLYSHELLHKESQKRMSHLLDARDYPLVSLFPSSREELRLAAVRGG